MIMNCMPAGEIVLRDEGTNTNWKVEVGAFLLASHPVTCELCSAVCAAGQRAKRARPVRASTAPPGASSRHHWPTLRSTTSPSPRKP